MTIEEGNLSLPVSSPEFLHDGISLLLRHVSMHGGDCEISLAHLLCQPLDLANHVTIVRISALSLCTFRFVLQKMTACVIVSVS